MSADVGGRIRLIWTVDPDGYEIVKRGPGQVEYIVPLSSKPRFIDVALLEHEIFIDLANSARLPGAEGILEFVNKWGLLTNHQLELVRDFLDARQDLRLAMQGDTNATNRLVARGRGPSGRRGGAGPLHMGFLKKRLIFAADSLVQFCALELIQANEGGIDVMRCGACGNFLPLHRKGRPKRYCGNVCRSAAFRAAHRDDINRVRRQKRKRQKTTTSLHGVTKVRRVSA